MTRKPEHAIVVDNYEEFRDDVGTFAAGKFNFLIVIGRTGVGKTETVREIVGPHLSSREDLQPGAFTANSSCSGMRPS